MHQAPVAEGDVLAGKYRVEHILGVGGMGVVVSARHLRLDERVALKFLLPEAMARSDVRLRFAQEGRAASKIRSEHVARVIDVGELDNGAPYMVMEYLEGEDLGVSLSRRSPLPVDDVADYVLQACEAIGEAHSLGIVHRDLKPANLFLTRRADGSALVKVLDFGISKSSLASPHDMALTSSQASMGSPLYMSPEQLFSAKGVDARSDIWSLGVILYELFTGHVPFDGETIAHLTLLITQTTPPPMATYRGDLPEGLDEVVIRCLAKDPGGRYKHVGELASALTRFAPGHARISADRLSRLFAKGPAVSSPADEAIPAPAERAGAALAAGTGVSWGRTRPELPLNRPGTAALFLLGLLGALVGGVALWRWTDAAAPVTSDSGAQAGQPPSAAVPQLQSPASSIETELKPAVATLAAPVMPAPPVRTSPPRMPAESRAPSPIVRQITAPRSSASAPAAIATTKPVIDPPAPSSPTPASRAPAGFDFGGRQ